MLRRSAPPTLVGSREAPTSATARGSRKRETAAIAAVCERCSKRSRVSGVRDVGSSISMAPSAECSSTVNPLSRNTWIMRWLFGSTDAVNIEMPCSSAASARCESMIVAIP